MPLTIEQYLARVGRFVDEPFAKQLRKQFQDSRGTSELAVLQAPSRDEYEQLCRLVAVMTPQEKADADCLSDPQIQKLAADARADAALAAIFFNGFVLELRKK
ncbi:MAG TPA: hypothetical protein PKB02_05580 [Anaerohalosphaeraceae bacterium]|nr:hypothetical protein [Anaerohalosphaeraceae bacterium]